MSKHSGNWWIPTAARTKFKSKAAGNPGRRLGFESLEERRLLTVVTPTSVTFVPQTGQGTAALTTANNSSTSKEMTFSVAGVTPGDTVYIFADGGTSPFANSSAPVATGASTISITTAGNNTLTDGSHTFTALEVDTTNHESAFSPASAPVQIYDNLTLTQTAVTATAGQPFTFAAQTTVPSGDIPTITAGTTLLPNMTFDSGTKTFSGWTPASTDVGTTQTFTVNLTDSLGNSTTVTVFVAVTAANTLSVVAPPSTIAVGSPVLVAFNTTNAGTPNFSVTATSNSSAATDLTATIMPVTNQYLQIDTSLGTMVFQLLDNYTPDTVTHFVDLVNSGTYNTNADFYRIIQTFVDQGGVGGTGSTIPVELNPDLRFTSSGLLAMANNGVDGNSSEFYITNPDDMSNGFLDFRYSIFGKLVSGDNVRQALAATQVGPNSSGETSAPFAKPTILSMSITSEADSGVLLLKAPAGASGSYTVTVSDGLGGSQPFTINVGTNSFDPSNPWVAPVKVGVNSAGANPGDQIYTAANTPVTFTPQGISADNAAVQVAAQLFVPLVGASYASDLVDNSYTGTSPPAGTNTAMKLTQNGSSVTVTPTSGDYGVQVLEIMGYTPVSGTFELQVGSTTTTAITFDSTNLAATAANIQSALVNAGFSTAKVTVASSNIPPNFNFDVAFGASESPIAYQASATALPVTFANSATAAAASQELTFTDTGTSWDSSSGVDPVYRAFVPVFVAPPTPVIASIKSNGQVVSGSTFENNSTSASEFTFNITGAVSGATVSVYLDGGAAPIASGTVTSNFGSITLTTSGSSTNAIADGNHVFTVVQSLATSAYTVLADWNATSSGISPGSQFNIPANSVTSPTSTGISLTIGLAVLAPPVTAAQVGVLYTYVVQTNAPAGDTVTVTPVTLPAGMVFTAPNTFTWTPSNAQLNTAPTFSATLSDTLGNTATIGPVNISVIIGLAPTQIPVNTTLGGNVTVLFSGSMVEIYNNITKSVLSEASFKSTDTVEVDAPAGQANYVTVVDPGSANPSFPQRVLVNGVSGATNDAVYVYGNLANNFNLAGATASDNGLVTQIANVQKFALMSPFGNGYYNLASSTAPSTWVIAAGSNNSLDFSHDTAGVAVNLGLDAGQAQYITPWGNNLSIQGVISYLTGTAYSDTLTGGPAATTLIRSGAGNDRIVGGSGNNALVGGGGNDTIIGGPAQNLIIAGSGTDSIYATGQSNIVFGGTTNYDSNNGALVNLLAQGIFAAYGYSYRRALASTARNPALASSMLTFHDSGAADVIFGSYVNNWLVLGKNDVVEG
jgi:cyclophilin family peptidyl-prolyl cis-trans isomerase